MLKFINEEIHISVELSLYICVHIYIHCVYCLYMMQNIYIYIIDIIEDTKYVINIIIYGFMAQNSDKSFYYLGNFFLSIYQFRAVVCHGCALFSSLF